MATGSEDEALARRTDGRLYPRITRRCARLLQHIRTGRQFDLVKVAREVQKQDYPEFRIRRGNKPEQIKTDRIRDYLSYLKELNFIQASGNHYTLQSFKPPQSDQDWVQTLADRAQVSLAKKLLGNDRPDSINKIPDHLEEIRKGLHEEYHVPTLAAVIGETGITGARNEEVLRWSLYLYFEGGTSDLDVRRYSHITPKDEGRNSDG